LDYLQSFGILSWPSGILSWPSGIFCGNVDNLVYIFPVLVRCTEKNLATLIVDERKIVELNNPRLISAP
jgi:hypothetical protein